MRTHKIQCGYKNPESLRDFGATVKIRIGLDSEFKTDGKDPPNISAVEYNGHIDTGATRSCIDFSLAKNLGLPFKKREVVYTPGGKAHLDTYHAQVIISSMGVCIHGEFLGADFSASNDKCQALLGRDFLQDVNMVYNGITGSVTLSKQESMFEVLRRLLYSPFL